MPPQATGRETVPDSAARTECHSCGSLVANEMGLDDVRHEFGDRWDIVAIAQGYRAVLRDPAGGVTVVLYGRTPAELAESVRMAQVPS
jgi:hypothetical protein